MTASLKLSLLVIGIVYTVVMPDEPLSSELSDIPPPETWADRLVGRMNLFSLRFLLALVAIMTLLLFPSVLWAWREGEHVVFLMLIIVLLGGVVSLMLWRFLQDR